MKNKTSDAVDPAEKSKVKNSGDMFPADLEFIDDADVVTEPDGSTVLIKDEHPTTLKPVSSSISSQSVRDTSNKTVDSDKPTAELNETMTMERLLAMNNASKQDNQTDDIIKLLKRQAPLNPPQMVLPQQVGQPPQQFFQQQPIPISPQQQQFLQQQQFIQQPFQSQPILINQMPRVSRKFHIYSCIQKF